MELELEVTPTDPESIALALEAVAKYVRKHGKKEYNTKNGLTLLRIAAISDAAEALIGLVTGRTETFSVLATGAMPTIRQFFFNSEEETSSALYSTAGRLQTMATILRSKADALEDSDAVSRLSKLLPLFGKSQDAVNTKTPPSRETN